MAVQHAKHKHQVLTEIMKLMDHVGGKRLAPGRSEEEDSEPEETDDAPVDHEPKKPEFTWAAGPHKGEGAGDEEDAPSDDELNEMAAKHAAMGAKLAKHGR